MSKTPAHVLERKKAYYQRNRAARLAYQKAYNAEDRGRTFQHQFTRMLASARARCMRKKFPMDLTVEWCMARLEKAGGKCEKTSHPFTEFPSPHDPWRVSFDRIDNSKGYTEANVQLVCSIYNMAKNVYTDAVLKEFCEDYLKTSGSSSN